MEIGSRSANEAPTCDCSFVLPSSCSACLCTVTLTTSDHEPNGSPAGIPLQAHIEEFRRRCDAVARLQGGSTHYLKEVRIFRSHAAERGFILGTPPEPRNRPPDYEWNVVGRKAYFFFLGAGLDAGGASAGFVDSGDFVDGAGFGSFAAVANTRWSPSPRRI